MKSLAYLAGVGANAMDYEGPCPFQLEDIGYNDYADGLRDGAPSPMIDGETLDEIAADREHWQDEHDKQEDNNDTLRSAIDDAIDCLNEVNLMSVNITENEARIAESIKILNEALK